MLKKVNLVTVIDSPIKDVVVDVFTKSLAKVPFKTRKNATFSERCHDETKKVDEEKNCS